MKRKNLLSRLKAFVIIPLGLITLTQCEKNASENGDEVAQLLSRDQIEDAIKIIHQDTAKLPGLDTPSQKTIIDRIPEPPKIHLLFGGSDKPETISPEGEAAAATITQEAFQTAVRCSDIDTLKKIFKEHRPDMTVNTPVEGLTPLMWAARQGKYDEVKRLLKEDADDSISSDRGYTALMYAACNGSKDIVKLLDKKERIDELNPKSGLSALMYVCLLEPENYSDVVKALVKADADKNCRSQYGGLTPLMLAARKGNLKLVEQLKPNEIDIIIEDVHGDTCIDYAERSNNKGVVALLEKQEGISDWMIALALISLIIIVLAVLIVVIRSGSRVCMMLGAGSFLLGGIGIVVLVYTSDLGVYLQIFFKFFHHSSGWLR